MRIFPILISLMFLAVPVWAGEVWNAGFEASPADLDAISAGARKIRDTRTETRERGETDLCWGSTGTGCEGSNSSDNGRLREGAARAFHETAAPTQLQILDYNPSGAGSQSLDDGRVWADSDGPDNTAGGGDDDKLYIYDSATSTWKEATAQHDNTTEFNDGPNLLYNGSFEATDGTGAAGATEVPAGWVVEGTTPTFTYQATDSTEDAGLEITVTDSGVGLQGINQVLTNLKASATYRVTARVNANAGDSCRVKTTGAATDMADTDSATTGSYETITGTFITAAALDTVTVHLLSVAVGDICNWDRVSVVEQATGRIKPYQTIALYDTDTATSAVPGTFTTVPNLSVSFTPPGPNWIIEVGGTIAANKSTTNNEQNLICHLDEATAGDLTGTEHGTMNRTVSVPSYLHVTMKYIITNPTPGTALTYTAECLSSSTLGTMSYNGSNTESNLWLIAHPPR